MNCLALMADADLSRALRHVNIQDSLFDAHQDYCCSKTSVFRSWLSMLGGFGRYFEVCIIQLASQSFEEGRLSRPWRAQKQADPAWRQDAADVVQNGKLSTVGPKKLCVSQDVLQK